MEMASIVELMTLGNCQLAATRSRIVPGLWRGGLPISQSWTVGFGCQDSADLARDRPTSRDKSRAAQEPWTQDKAAFALPPGTIRKMLAEWLMRGLATVLETLQGNASSSEVLTGQNGLALRGMRS